MPIELQQINDLPTGPGVYLMKDAKGEVLYIGKAINLRSRVRSYFRESGDERWLVPFLRTRVEDVETILTDTEKEALLLENTLIKKHKPRYNIRLRDDKTYISLRLDTTHRWPRLHRVRKRRAGDKALYFGPYSSSKAVNETMRFLQRLFPIRSCSDRELENRARPCILHQIDRCSAPCVGKAEEEEYREFVESTLLFLRGRREEVLRLLRAKMNQYSDELRFEKAAMVRDRLAALEKTIEEEKVHSHRAFNRDVIVPVRRGGRMVFGVLSFRSGRLESSRTYSFKDLDVEDPRILEDFLSQYYSQGRSVPLDVLVPVAPENEDLLARTLSEQREGPVHFRVPERGEKRRLLDMARQNAEAALERELTGEKTVEEILRSLQQALRLDHLPRHIECVDISNFQGSFNVGSLVSFRDGEPDKTGYRRFKIRSVEGQNDFASMNEVLERHFSRVLSEEDDLPDLLIIDGGIGQLNIAVEVLRSLGLVERLPVAGMAKARLKGPGGPDGEKTRTEERLFLPGRKNPVRFRRSDPALHLLQRIRDESHRFGITYHRMLRSRSSLRTGLEEIPGVGPKRRRLLLRHFGSLSRVRSAELRDLQSVPGVPSDVGERIHRFFHPPEEG